MFEEELYMRIKDISNDNFDEICRIKRKEVVAKQPEKNGSSWSLSEEGFEHG